MTLYTSRAAADTASERLKVYAQPQRLMILSRLLEGECTVSEIDAATGIGQPALSQQLAELRRADVVQTRREAKQIHYRLADAKVEHCVRSVEAMFGMGDDAGGVSVPVVSATGPRAEASSQPGAAAFVRLR